MGRCANCGMFAAEKDLVIDHIAPRSSPNYNSLANLQTVHINCKPAQPKWYVRLWRWIMKGWA